MSLISVIILLLLLGIAGYGIYASMLQFFIAGVVGCLAVILNLTTNNVVLKPVSYYAMFGALIWAAYIAIQAFF